MDFSKIKRENYYFRKDCAEKYTAVIALGGHITQSAEFNEMQSMFLGHIKGIADAVFKDGDILEGCKVILKNGKAICEAGKVYLDGLCHYVEAAELTLPTDPEQNPAIGIMLTWKLITPNEDPSLRSPVRGLPSEGQDGADRVLLTAHWALNTDDPDIEDQSEFFPVHTMDDDGNLDVIEAPPSLDAVNQSIASYDRQATGGNYVVEGMAVRKVGDNYILGAGRARVGGYGVTLDGDRRLNETFTPQTKIIDNEPHQSSTRAAQRVLLNHTPAGEIKKVNVTLETTEQVTRGAYAGGQDRLANDPAVKIVEIKQGDTTYVKDTDYKLTAGKVDWSPSGAEPAPGSSYDITYQHYGDVTPTACDTGGFTVEGAVEDTQIRVTYDLMLPRIDAIVIDKNGRLSTVHGTPAEWGPKEPRVDNEDTLAVAHIHQNWDATTWLANDGLRVTKMSDLETLKERQDTIVTDLAELKLTMDASGRESGMKKGLFADPFLSDAMRDQGYPQAQGVARAAVFGGMVTLPVEVATVARPSGDVDAPYRPEANLVSAVAQLARTSDMRVNPYDAFDAMPADVTLTPSLDRWTESNTIWASEVTRTFTTWSQASAAGYGSGTRNDTLSTVSQTKDTVCRQIEVGFLVKGFGPHEDMTMTFDGIDVTPTVTQADANGVIQGKFTIPANVPTGKKTVAFTGSGGSHGEAIFTAKHDITTYTMRKTVVRVTDPLAQTFSFQSRCQIAAADLWFTAIGTGPVDVQIRAVQNGFPTRDVLAFARVEPGDVNLGGATRVRFAAPVTLEANIEYALVVLCADATTALSVAEVGKWDSHEKRWVGEQPYQVGVLLSSSNASTWTAHQTMDLTFQLLKAEYQAGSFNKALGNVDVQDATEIMVLAGIEQSAAESQLEFLLGLGGDTLIAVSDGQPVRLAEPYTGPLTVQVSQSTKGAFAPVLYPGVEIIAASAKTEADYISRAIPAGQGSTVKVILDTVMPAGSNIKAQIKADGDTGDWQDMTVNPVTRPLDNGKTEITWTASTDADSVRVRLLLTGTPSSRPEGYDLRVITM